VGHLLPNSDPVHKVSIISRGQALGYTISLPTEDKFLTTRAELQEATRAKSYVPRSAGLHDAATIGLDPQLFQASVLPAFSAFGYINIGNAGNNQIRSFRLQAQRGPIVDRDGDVLVTNDPHPSGVHLNDVSLISPVHHDGALLGYVANLAHHVDVGGGAPAGAGPNDPTVLFGARPEPGTQQGTTALEGKIGRRLAAVRVYYNWDSPFPDTDVNWFNANGYTLLLSVKSERRNHTFVQWRDIANAQPGSTLYNDIVRWASRVKALGNRVYFTFNHEPETALNTSGNGADFIAAWRKVVTVFRQQGVANADYLYVLSALMVVPTRWLQRYGWRKVCCHEQAATYWFYRELGQQLGIQHIPPSYQAVEQWIRPQAKTSAGSPRARRGFRMLPASVPPSPEPPAPTTVWISSMNTMNSPLLAAISSMVLVRRSSKSPR
jgi:hypothetical protein